MAVITSGAWPSLMQKDLSLVFLDQFRSTPSMLPFVYRFKDAEQGVEYDLETGDIGTVPVFDGEISYDDTKEGYKKSVQETEYSLGLKATRRMIRNDLYGVFRDRTELLAMSFKDLRENRGAFPFNNAFNGSFIVGDGLSLCNSTHTSKYSGSNQSNTSTAAFSAPNVFANGLLMQKFKTNRDNNMHNIPDTLIIPIDLMEKAYEIIKSSGKVDTANNNRNYHEGRYKVICWPNYLTSTTAWFFCNSMMMRQRLVFREWEPVQFFRSGEFDTLVAKFAGYCSFEISTVEWRWLIGSTGA